MMAGPSTTPPTDEPYQVYFQGPRVCNMDPQLMREFTVVVRCNRDGVEFSFTADLESVMQQHLYRQCTPEHGSKEEEDLETHIRDDHKEASFRSQSTAIVPQIPPPVMHSGDESGPSEAEPLNLQSVLDTAFARAQSSHARIDNRGTWFLKLDITFMVKNSFGETLQIELNSGTNKVDKQPEERRSSNAPLSFEFLKNASAPFSFEFLENAINAIDMKNKQLEDSNMPEASLYLGIDEEGKQLEEESYGIIKFWTVTKNDKGVADGAAATRGAQGGGHGGVGGGVGVVEEGGDGVVGGGGHGSVGGDVVVVEEEGEDEGVGGGSHGGAAAGGPGGVGVVLEEGKEAIEGGAKGVVEGDEEGDSVGELLKQQREVLLEKTQATINEMVEELEKKISKMFNEFKQAAYVTRGAVGDP